MRGVRPGPRTPAPFLVVIRGGSASPPVFYMDVRPRPSRPPKRSTVPVRPWSQPASHMRTHNLPCNAMRRQRQSSCDIAVRRQVNSVGARRGNGSGRGRRFASHHAEACVRPLSRRLEVLENQETVSKYLGGPRASRPQR